MKQASIAAPAPLGVGETIAVVAPAGPVEVDRLKSGLQRLGGRFKLRVAEDIDRKEGFLAGHDLRRAEELNAALRDPEVRCIWAARGGYGCSRILPLLDAAAFRADPKPIVGFSDLTALLCWAAAQGVESIHGPVLVQLGRLPQEDVDWVLQLAMGQGRGQLLASGIEGLGQVGRLRGRLVGGNLSLLAHLCGTRWAPSYSQAICIAEDVGERPYAIDRYLGQLLAQSESGLCAANAVLLGDFTRCEEAGATGPDVIAVALKRLRAAGLLAGSGVPLGHGDRNRAFAFGAQAELDAGVLRLL